MLCLSVSGSSVVVDSVGADTCPAGDYVAFTQAEVNDYLVSPFKLTLDEGAAISTAVIAIWALGYGIRMAIRTLRERSDGSDSSSE